MPWFKDCHLEVALSRKNCKLMAFSFYCIAEWVGQLPMVIFPPLKVTLEKGLSTFNNQFWRISELIYVLLLLSQFTKSHCTFLKHFDLALLPNTKYFSFSILFMLDANRHVTLSLLHFVLLLYLLVTIIMFKNQSFTRQAFEIWTVTKSHQL